MDYMPCFFSSVVLFRLNWFLPFFNFNFSTHPQTYTDLCLWWIPFKPFFSITHEIIYFCRNIERNSKFIPKRIFVRLTRNKNIEHFFPFLKWEFQNRKMFLRYKLHFTNLTTSVGILGSWTNKRISLEW